jgi:hypothetical protein
MSFLRAQPISWKECDLTHIFLISRTVN